MKPDLDVPNWKWMPEIRFAPNRANVAVLRNVVYTYSASSQKDDFKLVCASKYAEDDNFNIPEEIVKGLLHRRAMLNLGGGAKTYKTWTLLDLAISVSTGNPFWGLQTSKTKTLYINFELDEPFIHQRIWTICKHRTINLPPERLLIYNRRGKSDSIEKLVQRLIRHLKDREFGLIIFDPIYKCLADRSENDAGHIADLLRQLERVSTEVNAAVAFASHFSKGNQAWKSALDRFSGSSVFARHPDSLITITEHEQPGCFAVESTLRNHAPMQPFVLRWNDPIMEPDRSINPMKLKRASGISKTVYKLEEVLALLAAKPMSLSEWATAAENKLQMPKGTLKDYASKFKQKGLVRQDDERKYFVPKP